MHAAQAVVATWINDALFKHQHAVITAVPRISGLASVRRFRRTSQRSRLWMEIAHVSWSNEFGKFNLASTDVPQIQIPPKITRALAVVLQVSYTYLMMHLNLEHFDNALRHSDC